MRAEPMSASTSTSPLSIIGPTTVGPWPVTMLMAPFGKLAWSAGASSAFARTP